MQKACEGFHAQRLLCGVGGLLLFCSASAIAQSVQETLPLEQTVDGITLSIHKAGFYTGAERRRLSFDPNEDLQKGFILDYEVHPALAKTSTPATGEGNPAVTDKKLTASIADVRLFSPTGEPLYQREMARSSDGGFDKWRDVAPYWDHVTADFALLDPVAPANADGKFQETLQFKDVPLPQKFEQPAPVNRTLTTPQGTCIVLEKVTAHAITDKEGAVEGQLELTVRWDEGLKAPDAEVELQLTEVTDSTGKALLLSGSSSRQGNRYTFPVPALPPKMLKTINVSVAVSENAPSLLQPQWFKHFRFNLKLPPLAAVEVDVSKPANIEPVHPLISDAEGVKAEWQSLDASTYSLRGQLWLEDKFLAAPNPPTAGVPDGFREWFVKDALGRDAAGREYKAEWDDLSRNDIYFKSDGRPAHEHEQDQWVSFSFPDNHKPDKFSIEAVVERRQHLHQVFNFSAVTMPQLGGIAEVNKEVKAASGARTILRRVVYFTEPDQLSGAPRKLRDKLQPARGLALIFEAIPTPGHEADKEGKQDFRFTFASDHLGRDLKANRYDSVAAGDALVATMPPELHRWTVFLLPPASNAKTLNVQVVTDEIYPIGPSRTVTFKDVPLPAPQPIFLRRLDHSKLAARP